MGLWILYINGYFGSQHRNLNLSSTIHDNLSAKSQEHKSFFKAILEGHITTFLGISSSEL